MKIEDQLVPQKLVDQVNQDAALQQKKWAEFLAENYVPNGAFSTFTDKWQNEGDIQAGDVVGYRGIAYSVEWVHDLLISIWTPEESVGDGIRSREQCTTSIVSVWIEPPLLREMRRAAR